MAYEYFENRNLNAADQLNAVQGNPLHPRFDNNRFGGQFGGPAIKNKLFFFANYEYNPIGSASSGGQVFAPTAAGYATLAGIPGINQTQPRRPEDVSGHGSCRLTCCGHTQRRLSADRGGQCNRSARRPTNAVPLQIGQIVTQAPNFTNNEAAVAAVDYTLSGSDNLRGRFILNRQGSIDTNGFPAVFYNTLPINSYSGDRSPNTTTSRRASSMNSGSAITG